VVGSCVGVEYVTAFDGAAFVTVFVLVVFVVVLLASPHAVISVDKNKKAIILIFINFSAIGSVGRSNLKV
jgi:hypothetical protein